MAIGMTYEQYWHGDTDMVKEFREADKLWQERENERAWLHGAYVYHAISAALQNAFRKKGDPPASYPDKPYAIFKEHIAMDKEQREEQEALRAKLYMQNMVRMGKGWGKHPQ